MFIILAMPAGCIHLQNYGRIGFLPAPRSNMSVGDLIDNHDRYHVYYGGSSEDLFTALLFDPVDDGLKIIPKDWVKVEEGRRPEKIVLTGRDKESDQEISGYITVDVKQRLRFIVSSLETDPNNLVPFLRAIYGPDNRMFGYIFISDGFHVLIKAETPDELSILNPLYEYAPTGGMSNPLGQ